MAYYIIQHIYNRETIAHITMDNKLLTQETDPTINPNTLTINCKGGENYTLIPVNPPTITNLQQLTHSYNATQQPSTHFQELFRNHDELTDILKQLYIPFTTYKIEKTQDLQNIIKNKNQEQWKPQQLTPINEILKALKATLQDIGLPEEPKP